MTKNAKATTGKKEFNPSIGFWPTQKGTGYSVFVDEKVKADLEKAAVGSRLFLQEVESDNPKAPAYRVTVMPAQEETTSSL
jgi:hypothetical protein